MFTFTTLTQNLRHLFLAALAVGTFSLTSVPTASACGGPMYECAETYTVQAGDTLYGISLKYHVELWTINEMNYVPKPKLLQIGQKLCIPNTTPPAAPRLNVTGVEAGRTVTVQVGNLAPNQKVEVRLGKNGTLGVNGVLVGTATTDANGQFSATYTLPENLRADAIIAIRVESQNGRYAYDWFWNQQ